MWPKTAVPSTEREPVTYTCPRDIWRTAGSTWFTCGAFAVNFKMAKHKWGDFKAKMKEKRENKTASKEKSRRKAHGTELTVQRVAAEVSGKAQKYSRMGPREFVPFDNGEELTIDKIKHACEEYFGPRIGKNLVCDVLAGEQGPSCKTVDQIPSLKVIHVRFINRFSLCIVEEDEAAQSYNSSTSSYYEPPTKKHFSTKSELLTGLETTDLKKRALPLVQPNQCTL